MMLDQNVSIHHEAHEGHEERIIERENDRITTRFLFLRALRVLRGGILRI